jgi:hypothetical protein
MSSGKFSDKFTDNESIERWKAPGGSASARLPLLYGDFTPTENDRRLYELAKQYHDETEAYDQRVCSFRNERGIAMPKDHYERGLINRNAQAVLERLLAQNKDIGRTEIRQAISKYAPD